MIYFFGILLWISPDSVDIQAWQSRFDSTKSAQPLLRLKNSTWRRRFAASSRVLYGPPRFLPVFSETTLYPALTFLIIRYPPACNFPRSACAFNTFVTVDALAAAKP